MTGIERAMRLRKACDDVLSGKISREEFDSELDALSPFFATDHRLPFLGHSLTGPESPAPFQSNQPSCE